MHCGRLVSKLEGEINDRAGIQEDASTCFARFAVSLTSSIMRPCDEASMALIIVIKIPFCKRSKMIENYLPALRGLAVSLVVFSSAGFADTLNVQTQTQEQTKQTQTQEQTKDQLPPVSDAEQQALTKINTATGVEAKLKAAEEYIKKYPKSQMRVRVAGYMADEIILVKEPAQKISLARDFQSTFNQPSEADMIKPALVEAYLNTGKFDEALNESTKHLERNPEDVIMLTQLAWAGATQTQKGAANPKLQQTAMQASTKAIELMEADKKPERMTTEIWNAYRNSWLPRLYQAQGVMLYFSNNKTGAKEKLEKAAGFDPYDPPTLLMMVNVTNEDYQELAKKYGAEKKPELLNQALAKLDEVIDWMARAIAATEGNEQFKTAHDQLKENLKQYYSFRHDNKTDGMNELIQKYKKKS
jgi:tetratricopeptide (TPR) repeat protein